MTSEVKQDAVNKTLVDRLKACPKFECNFLFRRRYNANDDVSEITCDEGQFWAQEGSDVLYQAAKRFENNVSGNYELSENHISTPLNDISANYELSDNLPTPLYHEDRLLEPIRCSNDDVDAFPRSRNPQTPPRDDDFEDLRLLSSSYFSNKDFEIGRISDNEKQVNTGVPNLTPISDKENSFSSSSADMLRSSGDIRKANAERGSFYETAGMDDLYERIAVNTSVMSSSFNTQNMNSKDSRVFSNDVAVPISSRASRNQSYSNKFADVKTAKSLNLFIDEYPQSSFFSLLDSLQSNNDIERIDVFRKRTTNEEIRTRTSEDMGNFFHVIRNLSNLVELVLWNFHPEDLSSFCLGIADHPSIGNLQLHMECGTLDNQSAEAIASMPSLVSLELEVNESFPVWSLLESKSMVLLGVVSNSFDFEPNDVLRLAGRIRTNSVLRVLDLEPRIPSWCIGAVMASLRFSHTSRLETFRFSCQNDSEDQGDACMAEILKTIEYETPLRVLWNHSRESFSVSEGIRRKTMLAARRNPSLEQFHLFVESDE